MSTNVTATLMVIETTDPAPMPLFYIMVANGFLDVYVADPVDPSGNPPVVTITDNTSPLSIGTTHHIALRRVSGTITLELDGTVIATTTYAGAIGPFNKKVYFLGGKDVLQCSPGILDYVRITKNARGGTPNVPTLEDPILPPSTPAFEPPEEMAPDPEDELYPPDPGGIDIVADDFVPLAVLPELPSYPEAAVPSNVSPITPPEPTSILVDGSQNPTNITISGNANVLIAGGIADGTEIHITLEELASAVVLVQGAGESISVTNAWFITTDNLLSVGILGYDEGEGNLTVVFTKTGDVWEVSLTTADENNAVHYDAWPMRSAEEWVNVDPLFKGEAVYHFPLNEGTGPYVHEAVHGDGDETGVGSIRKYGDDTAVAWSGYCIHSVGDTNDKSLHFRGDFGFSSPTVFLPDYVTLVGLQRYTVEMLVQANKELAEYTGWLLWIDGQFAITYGTTGRPDAPFAFFVRVDGESDFAYMNTIPLGNMHNTKAHLAVTWDGSYLRFFVNAVLCGKVAWSEPPRRIAGFEHHQNQLGYPYNQGDEFISAQGFYGYVNHLTVRPYAKTRAELYDTCYRIISEEFARNWADKGSRVRVMGDVHKIPESRYDSHLIYGNRSNIPPQSFRLETDQDYLLVDIFNPQDKDFGFMLTGSFDDVSGENYIFITQNFSLYIEDGVLKFTDRQTPNTVSANPADSVENGEWFTVGFYRVDGMLHLYINDMVNPSASHPMDVVFGEVFEFFNDTGQIMKSPAARLGAVRYMEIRPSIAPGRMDYFESVMLDRMVRDSERRNRVSRGVSRMYAG